MFNSKLFKLMRSAALIAGLGITSNAWAQVPPVQVCTDPAQYKFDETVTWYFDLSGNPNATPDKDLYFWSWTPNTLPGGREKLDYHGNSLWSMTFIPTELYGVPLDTLVAKGNSAFWCSIQELDGTSVTGTLPYSMKEELRLGTQCEGIDSVDTEVKTVYLAGTSTESVPGSLEYMRPIFGADSAFNQQYEIFTNLVSNGYFNFQVLGDSDSLVFGGSNDVLSTQDTLVDVTTGGWKHITIDLSTQTYSVEALYGWNVVSNMLPAPTGWWGGSKPLSTYLGHGKWSATIDFSVNTAAADVPRLYMSQAGAGRNLKQVKGSKNQLIFEQEATDLDVTTTAVYHFNGEYEVILDTRTLTFEMFKPCTGIDTNRVVFLGSSVCKGYGADSVDDEPWLYQGYAYQFSEILAERAAAGVGGDYNTVNVSIGGNNTKDVLNRVDRHLWTQCGKYVLIGLSMANEGLLSGGQQTFDQFRDNMLTIIDTIRDHGMEPIIMSNYANKSYGPTEYNFIQQMNLLISQWDVPSVNLLGALEDGNGKFLTDYISDPWHPNTKGYTEFASAIVPSMIDAMQARKPHPVRVSSTYLSLDKTTDNRSIQFTPEGTVHPFTLTFDVRIDQPGQVATVFTPAGNAGISVDLDGNASYASPNGQITSTTAVADGEWHTISLTQYHADSTTHLYMDGALLGTLRERLYTDSIALNGEYGPSADYRELFFHRSAMTPLEIQTLHGGAMLKSSLEIYAPLDDLGVTDLGLDYNHAQSLTPLTVHTDPVNNVLLEAEDYTVAQSPVTEVCSEGGLNITDYNAGEWMVWYTTLPITGDYLVQFRVASEVDSSLLRFEKAGGSPIYGYITVPNTGDGQNWTTESMIVSLNEGGQHLAIWSPTGDFNINWINIQPLTLSTGKQGATSASMANTHSDIKVYPNPSAGRVNISGVGPDARTDIFSADGRLIQQVQGNTFEVNGLSNGIYILRVNGADIHRFKVVR